MRLTLRTMLAYLDDILEPSDAHELAKKIEDSEFAAGLVHRIRRSIGRLRLAAPKVKGGSGDVDPNTVAEYLDNTLASERVPDFETVCLESDVHLGEVASCHQVLTLVLGEPAQVDPPLRERVYRLDAKPPVPPDFGDDSSAGLSESDPLVTSARVGEMVETADADRLQPAPDKPDYLGASRKRRFWSTMATTILALLAIGSAVLVVDQLGGISGVVALLDTANDTTDVPAPPSEPDLSALTASSPNNSQPLEAASALDDDSGVSARDAANASLVVGSADHVAAAQTEADLIGGPPLDVLLDHEEPMMPGPLPTDPAGAARDLTKVPPWTTPDTEATDQAIDKLTLGDENSAAAIGEAGLDLLQHSPMESDELRLTSSDSEVLDSDVEVPEPPPVDVGTLVSDNQVLARWDESAGSWMRLPVQGTLAAGDQLIVLPTYRPRLSLSNGVELTFCGGTGRIHVEEYVDRDTPSFHVEYGRIVLTSDNEFGARIELVAGDRSRIVTLLEPQSVVAIDVQRWRVPGTDPEANTAYTRVLTWAVKGAIEMQSGSQPAFQIQPGSLHDSMNRADGKTLDEMGTWLESLPMKPIDRDASRLLEPALTEQRSIVSSLNEGVNDRRRELVALASRCLSHFDEFGPAIAALNDQGQRPWWALHFDSLGYALSASRESAAKVRQTLETQRGGHAAELYRLLWGFSDADLQSGADSRLVGFLRHPSLDFRVLSIETLGQITGKTLLYYPWVSERQRRASTQRWEKLQRDGQLLHRSPQFALPEPE